MSKGRFQKKTRRTGLTIALVILGIVVACGLGGVAYANSRLNAVLDEVNHVEVAKPVYDKSTQETEAPDQAVKVEAPESSEEAEETHPEVVTNP